jgi:hypothetical protein
MHQLGGNLRHDEHWKVFGDRQPGEQRQLRGGADCRKSRTGAAAPQEMICSIAVIMKQTARGSRTATLIVTENTQFSPQILSRSGTGTNCRAK